MQTARSRSIGPATAWLTLLVALGSAGCQSSPTDPTQAPASFAATTATNRISFDIDDVAFSPCTREDVHWTGTTTVLDHTTSNRGSPPGQHFVEVDVTHLVGVGLTSGGRYRFNSVPRFDAHSESPVNPYPLVSHFQRRDVVIGPTGGALGFLTIGFTLVVNGAGDLVLDREDLDFLLECK